MVEADLAASYHALLESDGELARLTAGSLERGHAEHGLYVSGRPLCTVLRPRFMSDSREARLEEVSEVLAGLLERAGSMLLTADSLLDQVGASEAEREIWAVDPGYTGFTLTSRLDAFMAGGRTRFVEYNAESPAGIGYSDILTSLFLDLPVMRRWPHRSRLRAFQGRRALTEVLLSAYEAWGGSGSPTIAVVDWEDVITRRDFELCVEYLTALGIETVITDPRRLEYRTGRLYHGETAITLVYRRVLLHELLERAEECAGLLNAYREGAVCMVNSPRSKLLHKKTVFAMLSDNRLGLTMSEHERRIVQETVPWTRIVCEGTTEFHGTTVDLPSLLENERERFALKPADDYGGRGVVLGWETEPDHWPSAIETALRLPYVAQERVDVPTAEFPVWTGEGVRPVTVAVDSDPLLFRGTMRGIVTRISESALLNVSAGTGSAVPTFVFQEKGA